MENHYLYGIRSILEAIKAAQPLEKVWLLKGQKSPLFKSLEHALRDENIAISYVPKERLDRFNNRNHQGAVAVVSPVKFHLLQDVLDNRAQSENAPIYLLLDHITDTRNLGAIIRTASATGVDAIILPQTGSARITADTVKTSAGAIFSVPLVRVDHLKDALYAFQGEGIKTIGLSEKASNSLYTANLTEPLALVMGSEEKGIAKSTLSLLEETVKLPMLGKIDSLNVSVACGTVLYEVIRQRNFA
ncbi:MAG: 23S rRNA (guanosine(2251)-2'-O)-methyltransferase RlmB [Flavobacteriaceae bacterium]